VCREPDDVVYADPPRLSPPLATVRAAHWARSDRQAALLLVLPVQQRLVRPADLLEASRSDRVRGRRELLRQLVADIADGAQSLGELDFARLCRRRGLPTPDRQVVIRTPKGRIYLDVRWSAIGLVVEIDGAGHQQGLSVMHDHLRQNRVTIGEDMVLRYDLFALRLQPHEVLDQVCEAYAVASGRRAS
jgi:very-short-patch-repair endonuclease